tara:strand:- start:1212 stop:1475 length:264 start_codon:yes stop_codon:yes gene_type:complete
MNEIFNNYVYLPGLTCDTESDHHFFGRFRDEIICIERDHPDSDWYYLISSMYRVLRKEEAIQGTVDRSKAMKDTLLHIKYSHPEVFE